MRISKLHEKQVQRASEWAQDFIIHLLSSVTTNLQILHKTEFSNSTLEKRAAPHTFRGYSSSTHVYHITSEVTTAEKVIPVHVMTAFEAVAVHPHSSLNFVTGYFHAPAVYPPSMCL